jgi:hypothetical protein
MIQLVATTGVSQLTWQLESEGQESLLQLEVLSLQACCIGQRDGFEFGTNKKDSPNLHERIVQPDLKLTSYVLCTWYFWTFVGLIGLTKGDSAL